MKDKVIDILKVAGTAIFMFVLFVGWVLFWSIM